MKVYEAIDKILLKIPYGRVYSENLESFKKNLLDTRKHRSEVSQLFRLMDAIDIKSAALLTHISLIFTALSVIYNSIDREFFFGNLISAEIILYLIITIPCLRCIRMMRFKGLEDEDEIEGQVDELHRRILVYRICNMSALLATCSLVLLFAGKAIL